MENLELWYRAVRDIITRAARYYIAARMELAQG